ncbi:hypothetical protein [Vibrio sp. 10N]|uniref:hypothetical protein n=1 Tax=Vibrio sp. 10N TaxID=3058938 RepID=UPI0028129917|nr:hypothetical protein VB10N_33900 [Vibrio sp. 10N]
MMLTRCISVFILLMLSNTSYACDKVKLVFAFNEAEVSYSFQTKDNDSDEEVFRQYFIFEDGDQIVVENKYCLINNYTIDYYSSDLRTDKASQRVAKIVERIQHKHHLQLDSNFYVGWLKEQTSLSGMLHSTSSAVEVFGSVTENQVSILSDSASLYIAVGVVH